MPLRSVNMRNVLLAAAICILAVLPNDAFAKHHHHGFSFQTLEDSALKTYQKEDYLHTLSIYQSYESLLKRQNRFSTVQPDLLYNQIITAYRNESYGLAAAYLTQYNLVSPCPDSEKALHEVRMLIEHLIYQKNPRMRFVRGVDPNYVLWTNYNQYTQAQLQRCMFIAWCTLFALIILLYALWNFRKSKTPFFVLLFFALANIAFLGVFSYNRIKVNHMTFGVITNAERIHVEPGNGAAHVKDDGFIQGLVVRVMQRVPGWLLVRRVDNVYGWISERDLYILHGKDEHKRRVTRDK